MVLLGSSIQPSTSKVWLCKCKRAATLLLHKIQTQAALDIIIAVIQ